MVKIVIPVSDRKGEEISNYFGRAPYFAWFDLSSGKIREKGVISNDSIDFGGMWLPPEHMMAMGADVVISTSIGERAIQRLQERNIAVLQAHEMKTDRCIKEYLEGKLKELTKDCL